MVKWLFWCADAPITLFFLLFCHQVVNVDCFLMMVSSEKPHQPSPALDLHVFHDAMPHKGVLPDFYSLCPFFVNFFFFLFPQSILSPHAWFILSKAAMWPLRSAKKVPDKLISFCASIPERVFPPYYPLFSQPPSSIVKLKYLPPLAQKLFQHFYHISPLPPLCAQDRRSFKSSPCPITLSVFPV